MKTFKLIGRPLDVAVEMALQGGQLRPDYNPRYTPEHSTDWSQGGPIIEQEKISVMINDSGVWIACMDYNYSEYPLYMQAGETALVAAMRSYVASKLGDDVDIPEELL